MSLQHVWGNNSLIFAFCRVRDSLCIVSQHNYSRNSLFIYFCARFLFVYLLTGHVKWQQEITAGTIQDHPVVANGIVYIVLTPVYDPTSVGIQQHPPQRAVRSSDGVVAPAPPPPVNGSCRVYGCNPVFVKNHTCQCNPTCK